MAISSEEMMKKILFLLFLIQMLILGIGLHYFVPGLMEEIINELSFTINKMSDDVKYYIDNMPFEAIAATIATPVLLVVGVRYALTRSRSGP